MPHQVEIGAYNLIKQSRGGLCTRKIISNSSIGEIGLQFICPTNKLWMIQQLTAYNGIEPSARICLFAIKDENNDLIAYLSNNGVAKSTVGIGDAKTYDGFGLSFIPSGWRLENRWFGLTVNSSVTFYAHITEIELT